MYDDVLKIWTRTLLLLLVSCAKAKPVFHELDPSKYEVVRQKRETRETDKITMIEKNCIVLETICNSLTQS